MELIVVDLAGAISSGMTVEIASRHGRSKYAAGLAIHPGSFMA